MILSRKPTYRAESLAAKEQSERTQAGWRRRLLFSVCDLPKGRFSGKDLARHILRQRAILQAACGKPSDPTSPFPRRASLAAVARKLGPIEIDDHPAELCECCGRTRHYGALRKPDGFRLSLEHLSGFWQGFRESLLLSFLDSQAAQHLQFLRHPLLVTHPSPQMILPM
jgi:hypothetical protein